MLGQTESAAFSLCDGGPGALAESCSPVGIRELCEAWQARTCGRDVSDFLGVRRQRSCAGCCDKLLSSISKPCGSNETVGACRSLPLCGRQDPDPASVSVKVKAVSDSTDIWGIAAQVSMVEQGFHERLGLKSFLWLAAWDREAARKCVGFMSDMFGLLPLSNFFDCTCS